MKGLKALLIFTTFAIITAQVQSNRPPCKGVPDGTFVQDPSSCERWVQCFNEEGIFGRCRDGYIFDRRTGSCNYKDKVDCRIRNPCKGKSDGFFVNNHASCASYFVCIGEDPKSGSCPGDLYFNSNKQQCVQPREYECNPVGSAKADIACQGIPDYSFVENEETCGEYLICVAERGRPGRCPNNYLYNVKEGICDFKVAIDCPEPTTTPTPEINICFDVENGKFIKDPTSCPAYIQCIDGEPVNGACENGLWFNPKNGLCDFQENVQCTPNPCEGKQNGEFMVDPEICGAFLQCVDGTSKPGRCPDGLLFNPINGYCDYVENVDCGEQRTTTTATTEVPEPLPENDTTTTTFKPPVRPKPTTTTTFKPPVRPKPTTTTTFKPPVRPKPTTTTLKPPVRPKPTTTTTFKPPVRPKPTTTTTFKPPVRPKPTTTTLKPPVRPKPTTTTTFKPPVRPKPTTTTTFKPPVRPKPTTTTTFKPPLRPKPTTTTLKPPVRPKPTTTTTFKPPVRPKPTTITTFKPPVRPKPTTTTTFKPPVRPKPTTTTTFKPPLSPKPTTTTFKPPVRPKPTTTTPFKPPVRPKATTTTTLKPPVRSIPTTTTFKPPVRRKPTAATISELPHQLQWRPKPVLNDELDD